MSRAVLVGTNAYPFLIVYWLELAKKYWIDEVDAIYVAVSQPAHQTPWQWTRKYIEAQPKVKLIHTDMNWPASMNHASRLIQEDVVCLMHDDQFVLKKGVMDEYFKQVEENGGVLTEMHPIFSPKEMVEELMVRKWPDLLPIKAETGDEFSFYVNFTFVEGRLFRGTSLDFGVYNIPVSQQSELLDWTPLYRPFTSDTNFKFNLELYNQGAKVMPLKRIIFTHYIQQKYGVETFMNELDYNIPYVHLQTMAYHIAGLYFDLGEREALMRQSGGKVARKIENEAGMSGQLAWRQDKIFKLALIYEFLSVNDFDGIAKYRNHTYRELDWMIERYNFDKLLIKQLTKQFHKLFIGKI